MFGAVGNLSKTRGGYKGVGLCTCIGAGTWANSVLKRIPAFSSKGWSRASKAFRSQVTILRSEG